MIRHENEALSREIAYCPHCGGNLTTLDQVVYGNIELRAPEEVVFEGKRVNLTRNQLAIVDALVRAKGRAITRSVLAMIIGKDVYDNTVSANIRRTRQSFHTVSPEFDQLQVLHGLGAYRWNFRAMS